MFTLNLSLLKLETNRVPRLATRLWLGYNQIRMSSNDKEKMTFITDWGLYCYKAMPFGLTNASSTYQRLVSRMFKEQIGRNM